MKDDEDKDEGTGDRVDQDQLADCCVGDGVGDVNGDGVGDGGRGSGGNTSQKGDGNIGG